MNNKQIKTLNAIFSNPAPKDITWDEIESLFLSIGAKKREMRGSRTRFVVGGKDIAFHRPHNPKTLKPYQIEIAKKFFEKIGIKP